MLFGFHRIRCSTYAGFGVRDGLDFAIFSTTMGDSEKNDKDSEQKKTDIKPKKDTEEAPIKEMVQEIIPLNKLLTNTFPGRHEETIDIGSEIEIQKVSETSGGSSDNSSNTTDGILSNQIFGKGLTEKKLNPGKVSYVSDYSLIRVAIEKAKTYPYLARKRGIEGAVTAEFAIDNKGLPQNIIIVKSSGYELLDKAARDTILRAAPFPLIQERVEIPITFRLKNN